MSSSGRVRKQHVVSAVLLKRFARKGQVLVEDMRWPGRPPRPKSPRAVGYVEDYVRADSASVEAVWQAVETRLHAAFADVDVRQVVAAGSGTEVAIKDCLALHWARSEAVRAVAERAFATVRQDSWDHWATQPALNEIFRREHGLAAAGPQARAMVNDRLHSGPPEVVSGQHFAARVVGFFNAARTRFAPYHLQVGDCAPHAPDLVISDAPVTTPSRHRPGLNPDSGVPLGEATAATMPLGPRIAVCLHPVPERVVLDSQVVTQLNDWQRQAAVDHLYRRP